MSNNESIDIKDIKTTTELSQEEMNEVKGGATSGSGSTTPTTIGGGTTPTSTTTGGTSTTPTKTGVTGGPS